MDTNNTKATTPDTANTEAPAVNKAPPLDITMEASVRLIPPKDNLLAFATVKMAGHFIVDNVKVIAGKDKEGKDKIFVDMPSKKDAKGNFHDVFFPITTEGRQLIEAAVFNGYAAALAKNVDIGDAHHDVAGKPGIAERLAEGVKKAAAHNAARPAPATPGRAAQQVA